MIALTARLNERDETIIQLQEELDAYERIHRETEAMVEKKQDRIMQLESVMQQHSVEIPFDEEGADELPQKNLMSAVYDNCGSDERKYPPHEQYHLQEEEEDVPLQLLTANEKIEELSSLIEHKDNEMETLRLQLQTSVKPEQLKERVEQIVQKEVEERVRTIHQVMQQQQQMSDSGSSATTNQQAQQVQYMEKKLKIADEKNEALKNLLSGKDEEIERVLQQKVALTNLFENDLMQMTEKIIGNIRGIRSQDDIQQTQSDMMNLQKLIGVSFQALKGSMASKL